MEFSERTGLTEGLYDIIIAPLPITQGDLRETVIFEEPLYLTVPVEHELAQRDRVDASDLAGVDLLALGPGHQLRDLVVSLATEVGANVRYDYEGTSLDTLREMMATGLGVSLLPGLYVCSVVSNDPRFKIFQIGEGGMRRTIGMAWRKATTAQTNFERLAAIFREAVDPEFMLLAPKPSPKGRARHDAA